MTSAKRRAPPEFDILRAMDDPNLFGLWFRDKQTWAAWQAFLASLFALEMTDEQLALYRKHTGRAEPPASPATEAWVCCGRRAGKSFTISLVATYLACFRDYRPFLAPGERATVSIISVDRKQSRVVMRYIRSMLTNIPLLAKLIQRETAEGFDLSNRVTIEVTTASQRATRGYTYAAAILDELAFFPTDDAAEPDYAILDAIRPGMATIPNSLLICASSPYARRGALWDAYQRWWGDGDQNTSPRVQGEVSSRDETEGQDATRVANSPDDQKVTRVTFSRPLVWHATTRDMNPTVPQRLIDEAMERDPASASAEYLARFRVDLELLLTREAVRACVAHGCRELAPTTRHRYFAFCDPSGGSADSFTLAIAHREKVKGVAFKNLKATHDDGWLVVLDAIREVIPPFSPEAVITEFAATIRSYGLRHVTGDRYGGEFPREGFRRHGVTYQVAEQTRSDLYLAMVPAINSGRVRLLDHGKLENQLIGLERRTTRMGRDLVDHAPNAHDDIANAAAGALVGALAAASRTVSVFSIDMQGKVVVRDAAPRPRVWQRTPGISAVDGKIYETREAAHRAAGITE